MVNLWEDITLLIYDADLASELSEPSLNAKPTGMAHASGPGVKDVVQKSDEQAAFTVCQLQYFVC
jgi:hypothetical protein